MKIISPLIFLLLIVLFPIALFSQSAIPKLIPYRKGNLWGYCDADKKIIIPPKFEWVNFFNSVKGSADSYSIVIKKGESGLNREGVINQKGKQLVPCEYDDVYQLTSWLPFNRDLTTLVLLKFEDEPAADLGTHFFYYNLLTHSTTDIGHPERSDSVLANYNEDLRDAKILNFHETLSVQPTQRNKFHILYTYRYGQSDSVFTISKELYADELKPVLDCKSLFYIRRKEGWGVFSLIGKGDLIEAKYDSIIPLFRNQFLDDTIFAVQKAGLWAIISPSKNKSTPCFYQEVMLNANVANNGFLVKRLNKWGILMQNLTTEVLIDANRYNKYYLFDEKKLIELADKDNKRIGFVNYKGIKYWD